MYRLISTEGEETLKTSQIDAPEKKSITKTAKLFKDQFLTPL